jgi:folate-binding protein YgfZ
MRMLSGIAQWPGVVAGAEIPQSLGLRNGQELGLHKGCYPGQEIISRVHYRGRPPRRLVTTIGDHAPPDAFAQAALPLYPQWHIAQSLRSA